MKYKLLILLFALGCSLASGATVLLTFDELPTQQADGITINGISIGFSVSGSPSTDATYNATLPVSATYLDSQVLLGSILGTLSFQFAAPTPSVQFGLLLNTLDAEQPGAYVELFDSNSQSLGQTPLDTNPLLLFSEGLFSYSGTPVSRVDITFSGTTVADTFALDNLQIEADATVPEPGTILFSFLGLLGIGIGLRHKRHAA